MYYGSLLGHLFGGAMSLLLGSTSGLASCLEVQACKAWHWTSDCGFGLAVGRGVCSCDSSSVVTGMFISSEGSFAVQIVIRAVILSFVHASVIFTLGIRRMRKHAAALEVR